MSAIPMLDELKSANSLARLARERAAQIVVIALLIALALDSALILTRALGGGDAAPAPSPAPPAPHRPAMNPTLRLATVVNAHLFGLAGATAQGDAPPTTAALVLTGVLADRDPARGQAIIGEKAASAKLYGVGAAIPGGAHLRSVYSDHVLIERNGSLESVLLPHTPLKSAPPGPMAGSLLRTAAASPRDNATLLAGIMRVQPVFNQGKLDGYRIFPGNGRGAGAFQEMGLKAGDLILAVNGTALDDPSRAMEVLQTLSTSGSATVTVSREGTSQEIALNLATLNTIAEEAGAGAPAGAPVPPAVPGQRARFGVPAAAAEAPGEAGASGVPAAAAPAVAPPSPAGAPDDAASRQ